MSKGLVTVPKFIQQIVHELAGGTGKQSLKQCDQAMLWIFQRGRGDRMEPRLRVRVVREENNEAGAPICLVVLFPQDLVQFLAHRTG